MLVLNRFEVKIQELVSKVQNPGPFLRKNVFGGFANFVLLRGHFCTNLHKILAPHWFLTSFQICGQSRLTFFHKQEGRGPWIKSPAWSNQLPDLQHPLSDQQLFTPAIHFTLNSGVPLWQIDLSKDEILFVNSEIIKQGNSRFSPKIFFWVLQVCLPN